MQILYPGADLKTGDPDRTARYVAQQHFGRFLVYRVHFEHDAPYVERCNRRNGRVSFHQAGATRR